MAFGPPRDAGRGEVLTPPPPSDDPAVIAFLNALQPAARRDEARSLEALFRTATGWAPRLWANSIVGYGRYTYRYDSGRTGESCATGFSPRSGEFAIYIMPGLDVHRALLADLGRHRAGKGCVHIRGLSAIDQSVLSRLIAAGIADLGQRWPVFPD